MTNLDQKNKQRKIHHIQNYDYSQNGAYFITIVTQNRTCRFGSIIDSEMVLNDAGSMVAQVFEEMPGVIPGLGIDPYQIMPNHIHAIFLIEHPVGSGLCARPKESEEPKPSLFDIVARFKSLTTNRYIQGVKNLGWPVFERRLWQRSFYEHVIRNERDHQAIVDYIVANPMNWEKDEEFKM
ncbi:MAG TPA: transposase [Anaerolineaceae bacterium]|nr:transposase [Anaerolineaceae bacterium]